MAKRQIKLYKYTPQVVAGLPGTGTIVLPGKVDLFNILLITNVTRGVILFNFADSSNTGGTVSFKPGGVPTSSSDSTVLTYLNDQSTYSSASAAQLQNAINGQGETIVTITGVDTSGHASTDSISVFVEEKFQYTKPWSDFGTDAIERQRVANPQAQIDADFEYGLQGTKWQGFEQVTQYPSVFEVPGLDMAITNVTTDAGQNSLLTVTTSGAHGMLPGDPFTIQQLDINASGFTRAQGTALVYTTPLSTTFTYYAKGQVNADANITPSVLSPRTIVRKGGFYSNASLSAVAFSSNNGTPSKITIHFTSPHGFTPGMPLSVYADPTFNTNQFQNLAGNYFANSFPTPSQVEFAARGAVTISGNATPSQSTNKFNVYPRNDGFFLHRPGDGGILLGTASPVHGATATRQSKKYFRYQSGKGLLYTTGVLFAPNYDVTQIYVTNGSVVAGSANIRIKTSVPHGCQIGAVIRIAGVLTNGYNAQYTVLSIIDDNTLDVLAVQLLDSTIGDVGQVPKLFVYQWSGAVVRTGPHDDANGMFLEYDGKYFNCAKRTSTLQLAGTATFTPASSVITGIGTLWTSQLKIGDKIVVKGMVHRVSFITSPTSIAVTPTYRGISTTAGNYIWKVEEIRINQINFNQDIVDGGLLVAGGLNPSGYKLDPNKMQMIGIQFTWYGAGFMDFMVRGADANFIIMHRIKQNNVNNTASMRSANLPVRYEVKNESSNGVQAVRTAGSLTSSATDSVAVSDITFYPDSGYVFCDYELIKYSGVNRTASPFPLLTGLTRCASVSVFAGGTNSTFSGRPDPVSHTYGAGIDLVSLTASPNMSHWGSSYIMDGGFDFDRGYLFSYTANTVAITANTTSNFGVRLSPSASNGTTGDLGQRELLNRAQLLLQAIDITSPSVGNQPQIANCSILVTGILNPVNFYNSESWYALNTTAQGSQPSFTQIASTPTFVGGLTAANEQIPVAGTGQKALPGEKLFEFVVAPGMTTTTDLTGIKELTQSAIGGRGSFPNGPDSLYINFTLLPATSTGTLGNVSVTLKWAEAQA